MWTLLLHVALVRLPTAMTTREATHCQRTLWYNGSGDALILSDPQDEHAKQSGLVGPNSRCGQFTRLCRGDVPFSMVMIQSLESLYDEWKREAAH
jgi:hypothetical protein